MIEVIEVFRGNLQVFLYLIGIFDVVFELNLCPRHSAFIQGILRPPGVIGTFTGNKNKMLVGPLSWIGDCLFSICIM